MKFYILTSRDFFGLKNHALTIPPHDQVVVINSLDESYVQQAKNYCIENNIEYYITESDGTPGTGKNSVMKCFLESDNEYMVQVDGDDKITEYGFSFYRNLSKCKNPPDMVVLKKQWCYLSIGWRTLEDGTKKTTMTSRNLPWYRPNDEQEDMYDSQKMFGFWRVQKRHDDNRGWIHSWEHVDDEQLMFWAKDRCKLERWHWDIAEGNDEGRDVFSRMVFYSKKAAKHVKFTNELLVGEDMIAFYEIKRLGLSKELDVYCHDEYEKFTYIYTNNQKNHGIVGQQNSWQWVTDLVKYLDDNNLREKYDCIRNKFLPEITEEYYGTDS